MTKSEMAEALATSQNLSKTQATNIVDAIFNDETGLIATTLKGGGEVSFKGFGTFKVADRKARVSKNPKTGESIQVAAKKAPAFKAGKGLKLAVA